MARQSIVDDIAAQICCRYLHGEFSAQTNEQIHDTVRQIIPNKHTAIRMIFDIAYRIGYVKSPLQDCMSEVTYKIKKKYIRGKLVSTLKN